MPTTQIVHTHPRKHGRYWCIIDQNKRTNDNRKTQADSHKVYLLTLYFPL